MLIQVRPDGPIPASIMIVGEAPGADEVARGVPFVGVSGKELDKMLGKAGISRSECFVTNVARVRPDNNDISQFIASDKNGKPVTARKSQYIIPGKHFPMRDLWVTQEILDGYRLLLAEIQSVAPSIIVTVGNVSMWALTGKWGILKWRGSMLFADIPGAKQAHGATTNPPQRAIKLIPTIHPAAVLREWSWHAPVERDLKRAAQFRNPSLSYPKPNWKFYVRPTFDKATLVLRWLHYRLQCGERFRLSFDLETRSGHIACAGVSWSLTDAICIPLLCIERKTGYWTLEEEAELVYQLYLVLTHKNALVVGQNILYDSQYTYRHWHFIPNVAQDCMISQHSIFSSLQKSLAFQASMYCKYYVYWKDEGKDWHKSMQEDELWYYNCEDCVYTDECGLVELDLVKKLGLESVHARQQALFWPVLRTMLKGVRINTVTRDRLIGEVQEAIYDRETFIFNLLGHPLNPKSPKQMHALFYGDLQQPPVMQRATKKRAAYATLNDEALQTIARREPILKPLINAISDIRTMGIFLSNFLLAQLDIDGRLRCAYNIGGSESGKSSPKTFRLSSSEDAFGTGTNLQNVPSEKSKSVGKAAARGVISGFGDAYHYPNIRAMFEPDTGKIFFDGDLDRADLQVVAWEINDELLKAALRLGADIHLLNAFVLEGKEPPPLEELVESHPRYFDHRGPRKHIREFAKVFCHGTNYGGKSRTMAAHTGRTVHEIDRAQRIWFGAHPGIPRWHRETEAEVTKRGFVENRFGYRWYVFDRADTILPEALAWKPQSTVANVINEIWTRVDRELPAVDILLQVHDSIAGQFPDDAQDWKAKIQALSQVTIPYEDPLIIPFGIKTSRSSWGECK